MDLIYTKYMKAFISYEGIHRKETFFFPREAFRELLLNAVIHRDYMTPTPIQIRVYAHKIRIWNFGKMPTSVPVNQLFKPHSSEPRNPNIANVFFKAGYVESWGRGYKNIIDICELRKAKLPIPEDNSGGLVVECPPSKQYLDAEKKQGKMITEELEPNKNVGINVGINEKKALEIIKNNPTTSATDIAQKLSISQRQAERIFAQLKEKHLIERLGSRKNGYWKVNDV